MRRRGLLAGSLVFSFAGIADAQEPAPPPLPPPPAEEARVDPTFRKVEHERRAGVVIGGSFGMAFAGASGYPNNARLVGNPDYYSQTPLLYGPATSIFV